MKTDIAIIGGGLAGMAIACGLETAGIDYRLIEQRQLPVSDGMGIVLHPSGLHALHLLGVDYQQLNEYIPLSHMVFGTPKHNSIAEQPVGYEGYPVVSTLRSTLHRLLYRNVDIKRCLPQQQLVTVEQFGSFTRLTLSTGETVEARSVLFTDGIHGFEPEAAKIEQTTQGVWRWLIDTNFDQERAYEIHNGKYRLGIFPVTSSRAYVFLSSQPCAFNHESRYSNKDLRQILERFGQAGETVSRSTTEHTKVRFDRITENKVCWLSDSGFLRIGDAAHAVSPNLGMGASLAFEDAAELVKLIKSKPEPRIDSDLTRAYISARHKRVLKIKSYSRMFGKIAHLPGERLNHVKLAAIKYSSRIPKIGNGGAIYKPYFKHTEKTD
ncbi:NAD(P)/FAD-dependent oxidoreductase [Microbulbifer sp. HZ11]|uniref:FAD-dependent oxidoreductase n=1 Tax=Microbulbifer sp. HZ11 TaxID=1453501 RepID=UPI0005BD0591|nr:NAD(P)/FAD-dependent oxidoreductase [Microbulbifer sp. HZ11]